MSAAESLCTSDDPNDHQGDTCPIHEVTEVEAFETNVRLLVSDVVYLAESVGGSPLDLIDAVREELLPKPEAPKGREEFHAEIQALLVEGGYVK